MPRSGYYEDPIGRHFSRFYNGRGWAYIVRDEAGAEQVLYDADLNDNLLKTLEAPTTPPINNNKADFRKNDSSAGSDDNKPTNPLADIQPTTIAVVVLSLLVVILLLVIIGGGTDSSKRDLPSSPGGGQVWNPGPAAPITPSRTVVYVSRRDTGLGIMMCTDHYSDGTQSAMSYQC